MVKTVIEIPQERLERLEASQDKILSILCDALKKVAVEYLTVREFMDRCKISRWTVNDLRANGSLKTIQIGRKLYIPFSEVNRFFSGELSD